MAIRPANKQDALKIKALLESLGYPATEGIFESKLSLLLDDTGQTVMVHESSGQIDGLLTVQLTPRLATGELAVITYFALDRTGKTLEHCGLLLAMAKSCSWLQVYGITRRPHRWFPPARNRLRRFLMTSLEHDYD